MTYKIIEILFPVFVITIIGIIYAKKVKIDINSINKINLDIFIPFLIFYSISSKLPNISVLGYFSLGAIIIVFGSGLILYPFVKLMKLNVNSFLPAMMFNNSINLGLPLALLSFGQEAMALFIALSLVQVIGQFTIAEMMYGGKIDIKDMFKNPVIIATIFGLLFNYFNITFTSTINVTLELLSQVAIPLILFALGVRLSTVKLENIKVGIIGAILCPLSGLIMAFLAIYLFEYSELQQKLLILFGLLPTAVLNAILAEKYNKDSSMVASIVAIGNIFTIIYLPIALYFLL
ncbi:AEC family transporter [Aliarcobacter cibarius]|uniref:AEC family transporter n=1 Tax=Aliarcobacter cibarius TaxID=255507 RepID=A0ABY2V2N5_9BACT|nr:AEC family transporter [Aliarcobacter cibarius]TLS97243.1 AEC family transporter [Aliarcobacter cibarius]TLS97807.1 AEC family transporter [Aliarcobacter cibarius]